MEYVYIDWDNYHCSFSYDIQNDVGLRVNVNVHGDFLCYLTTLLVSRCIVIGTWKESCVSWYCRTNGDHRNFLATILYLMTRSLQHRLLCLAKFRLK
jgi:hypothetical protein